jgi:NADH:ubiquinone oxidoreductase subunit 5 (subunit L)/multisubunit Na+/H+ antiporter MnhA subunit
MQFFLLKNGVFYVDLFKWFKLNGLLEIHFELIIDVISFSFMFLTTTIAIFVNIFTFSYFRYEPNVERLLLLLNAFVLSMLFLVISGNLVLLFFGWEMIGLTSFLLINF